MSHVNVHGSTQAEIEEAVAAYAERHKLSKRDAMLEFSMTTEFADIYKRDLAKPRVMPSPKPAPISKAAQINYAAGISFVEVAKACHPGLSDVDATVAYLRTPRGAQAYTEFLQELQNARHPN